MDKRRSKVFYDCFIILWICLKLKQPSIVKENASNNVVINSELTMLSEKRCCIWTTTRDVKQRKFNYPHYYLYGLNLNIHCKLLHLFLLILLGGDIATNPGPISSSNLRNKRTLKHSFNCLFLNARSLKSIHKDKESNLPVCNLQCFQELVYSENSDVICVNETWLNDTISNKEILDPEFTIYRKDHKYRRGGGVLIAVKTDSFKSVKEFSHQNQEELEIVSTELKTLEDKKILYSCCYRPPDANLCWMDKFEYFLNTICNQYENVVIAGDFNLPNINWETMENTTGVNELFFVQMLNDHYLSQLNHTPSRGNNILDLVITNVPR